MFFRANGSERESRNPGAILNIGDSKPIFGV